ncbi:hypothetical protein [Paenibacillus sp. ISL-20]
MALQRGPIVYCIEQ